MTIRQILRYFAMDEGEQPVLVDDDTPLLTVYRSPGMHQLFDEADVIALTPEDRGFLRKLGIGSDLQ